MNKPRQIPNATTLTVDRHRRFMIVTQSPHAKVPLSAASASTPMPARASSMTTTPAPLQDSPLVRACRRYAEQHGGLGKRADADDNADSPLVRAAKQHAQQTQQR